MMKQENGEHAKPRRRVILVRLICVLGGVLVAWVLAEIVLMFREPQQVRSTRYLINRQPPHEKYYCYSTNPNDEFERLPDVSGANWTLHDSTLEASELPLDRLDETPYGVRVDVSEQGLRDRVYSDRPDHGVLRIAGIGDSFTFGQGVPVELTLFKQMETLLGEGYEVVNASGVGRGTREEADSLRTVTAGLNCQRAVVVFIVNDVNLNAKLASQQDYINDLINVRDSYLEKHQADAWYSGYSRLLRMIGSWMDMRSIKRDTIQWYRDSYDREINGANLNLLASDLERMAETPDCRVAFVMFPLLVDLQTGYPFRDIHEMVGGMAREAGMPVLDLEPVFRGHRTSSLHVHPADHHPNGEAHGIAARAIVNWLRRDVPGFLAPDPPDQLTPSPPPRSLEPSQ